jgi:predicted nucleic acid-binding protein
LRTLVDSNVVIARIAPERVEHQTAIDSVSHLLASGEELFVTPQNIAEFWRVAATPRRRPGGLGLTAAEARPSKRRADLDPPLSEVGGSRPALRLLLQSIGAARAAMSPSSRSSRPNHRGLAGSPGSALNAFICRARRLPCANH